MSFLKSGVNPTDQFIDQLMQDRAKEYAADMRRLQAQFAREKKQGLANERKQLQLLESIGIKKTALEREQRADALELKSFLEEARPPLIARPSLSAEDGKFAASVAANLPPGVHILPPYGVFAPPFQPPTTGEITSGWVFTSAGNLKIMDSDTGHGSGIGWASAKAFSQYDVTFTFTPAVTATYDLTAIFAFHGFYVMRADDGTFSSKRAIIDMRVLMSAYQYVQFPWVTFPDLIDRDEQNINEFDDYDQTKFFDYSAPLRAGDPVVVTTRIEILAAASGSGSYAEINFADGTANYIEPLFLSVGPE